MRIILILLIGLTIFGCGEDRRQRESFEIKRIESKRKSDSILSVELQKAKIPYKKNGINEELLEKYWAGESSLKDEQEIKSFLVITFYIFIN